MKEFIKLEPFGVAVACDKMRATFNAHNEQIFNEGKIVDYLFIGDSITELWDLHLYFDGFGFIVNRGIGGDTTKYLLKRAEADIFQLNPKNLVFMAGINDIISCSPDLWWKQAGADKETVLKEATENIEAIMVRCQEKGIKGYFCSVIPTDFCVPYNGFGLEVLVLKLNENIKALAKKYGMVFVDYYSEVCAEDGLHIREGYTYDGVHPNPACYAQMAKILKKYIGTV